MSQLKIELNEKVIERFWKYVDKKSDVECWEWLAGKITRGYGNIRAKNKMYLAHRVSWVLHNGEIAEGLCVCHKCDNPGCVNPAHLFLGTHKKNMRDMVAKCRSGKKSGECNGKHKLNEKEVIEIRAKYMPYKYTLTMLAKEYGVHTSAIYGIVKYITWKHVP